jgi:hypothetical protein
MGGGGMNGAVLCSLFIALHTVRPCLFFQEGYLQHLLRPCDLLSLVRVAHLCPPRGSNIKDVWAAMVDGDGVLRAMEWWRVSIKSD